MTNEPIAAQADNRLVLDMDIDAYHSHPAVSRSGLMLINQSPQHYWWKYLSGQAEKEDTTALRIGSAFHTLVLEQHTFEARAVIIPDGAPKRPSITQLNAKKPSEDTIAAIEWWARWDQYAGARLQFTQAEFAELQDMAAALLNQPATGRVIAPQGRIEASFFWYDPDYRVTVKCRPDYWREDGIVVDVKTTNDASRDDFEKSIVKYGYDVQAYMQMEGIERVTGKRPQAFVFACIEKKKPNATAFYMADSDLLECGKTRYHKLMAKYAECMEKGIWPGYGAMVQPIGVPSWFARQLENGEA